MPRQARVSAKTEKTPISQVRKRGWASESSMSASMVLIRTTKFGSREAIVLRRTGATLAGAVERTTKLSERPTKVKAPGDVRSEEHTSELQSHVNLVCRLLLEKKKKKSMSTLVE